ncbi:MAG: polysaccharide biosynthesis C-terminal domain-containing protein, partial [Candidatus Nealsonbacteria bacterium]|nr:polysaccharide biosynthesis C-terminal domain-containing protein [Candidatus Nealsonbacteria bacterium]
FHIVMFEKITNSKILNFQTKKVTFSAIILAFSTVASGLLGFLRDGLLSGKFGASSELDSYFAAFRIPDFIYGVLVYGGITVVFLPFFAEQYAKEKDKVWEFANNVLNVFLAFVIVIAAVCLVFAPALVRIMAPGFSGEQLDQTIFLTRVMLVSPILFGVSSVLSGILQYFNRFLAYGIAPLLYNLGIIAGIVFLTPVFGIAGVAYGVVLGAFFYCLVQLPAAVNAGFKYHFVFHPFDPIFTRAFFLMLPRVFSVAAIQLEYVVNLFIASGLAAGSVTIFNFTNNIYILPVSAIGVSFAMAAFPVFSKLFAESNFAELGRKFSSTFRQVAFIVIPSLSFLFVDLAGRYPLEGILKDLFGFNQLQDIRIIGLSLAFALAIFLQFLMALFFLMRKDDRLVPAKEIVSSTVKSILAGIVMAVAVYSAHAKIFFSQPFWDLAVYGVFGAVIYLAIATILRCREMEVLKETVCSFLKRFQQSN